jgi:hypothetical protein
MNPDIALSKLSVLDSEMAYREVGRTGRALPARQSHLLLYMAQHHPPYHSRQRSTSVAFGATRRTRTPYELVNSAVHISNDCVLDCGRLYVRRR